MRSNRSHEFTKKIFPLYRDLSMTCISLNTNKLLLTMLSKSGVHIQKLLLVTNLLYEVLENTTVYIDNLYRVKYVQRTDTAKPVGADGFT